jgi:hypothetical protein
MRWGQSQLRFAVAIVAKQAHAKHRNECQRLYGIPSQMSAHITIVIPSVQYVHNRTCAALLGAVRGTSDATIQHSRFLFSRPFDAFPSLKFHSIDTCPLAEWELLNCDTERHHLMRFRRLGSVRW